MVLTDREYAVAQFNQKRVDEMKNALGFELNITTLTAITKRVTEQKFFKVAPADYMPLKVGGEGAWHSNLVTYTSFSLGDDFEKGNINVAVGDDRLAGADAAISSLTLQIINWAKQINWNIPELRMAATSGNWELVTAKEKARKTNWDLGIQQVAFLGSTYDPNVLGLLTQGTVNSNTSLITQTISSMSDAQFQTLVAGLLEAYRLNCNRTAMPTHFVIPESDYNGLVTPMNVNFGIRSKLNYLQESLAEATMNKDFKILPLAYANKAINNTLVGLNKNRYTLLNYDEDSVVMNIPVDYTATLQNTVNGFQFQNVGYGQYTGVLAKRPAEMLYLDF
jgi:hypothetical protein